MAIIKCKMCGGDMELSSDKTIGTCEYCGSTMTMPTVSSEQRAAAFDRGNHFRRLGEFDKALSVYERIVQEDENDAEAHWCCALCRFGIEYVKDPANGEYLPTCHRASFDSFLEDVDYKAALAHADVVARRQYEQDGEKIAAVQRGILSTVQKEEPFDVFICYKETDDRGQRTIDSTLAQEIYYQLTEQSHRVFFARITLEDKGGQEYEPYIFAALHSAKVMVVVGTRPEYLNAVWVKNEWSRYLALMKNDRKRLLIPCYRDMDPYDLPEQLSVLQSYDMSKIGFIQDLIRGIAKVLDADKKPEPTRETVVVQGEGGNLSALLKRGNIALEDKDWAKADEFFERALDIDAECAEAYLGKALAERKCSTLERLAQVLTDVEAVAEQAAVTFPDTDAQLQALIDQYQIPGYLTEKKIRENFDVGSSRKYPIILPFWERRPREVGEYFGNNKLMSRAMRYARGECAQSLQTLQERVDIVLQARIANARETDRKEEENVRADQARKLQVAESRIQQLHENAAKKREADYATACSAMERGELQRAIGMLGNLGDYRDSADLLNRCREESERLKAEEKAAKEKEERAKQEAKEKAEKAAREARAEAKKRNKKIAIISGIAAVLVIAVILVMTQIVIPGNQYKNAEALLAAGEYDAAIEAFTDLGGYSDANSRANEATYAKGEALLAQAEYDLAIQSFAALGDYSDAKERVAEVTEAKNEVVYAQAEALLAAAEYDAAIVAFSAMGDYSDAKNRIKEATYAKAEKLLEAGNYVAASRIFTDLGNYSDAQDRVNEIAYIEAEALLTNGDRAGAYAAFVALGDYRDAADRAHDIADAVYQEIKGINFDDGELHDLSEVMEKVKWIRHESVKEMLQSIPQIQTLSVLEGKWVLDVSSKHRCVFSNGIMQQEHDISGTTGVNRYSHPVIYYNGDYWWDLSEKDGGNRSYYKITSISSDSFQLENYGLAGPQTYTLASRDTYKRAK